MNAACAALLLLPPLGLAQGLPSEATCRETVVWAGEYASSLSVRSWTLWDAREGKPWNEADSWTVWAQYLTCRDAVEVWEWAAVAADGKADPVRRREALQWLVDAVGWRAVLTGELPPPVPLDLIPEKR